MADTKGWQFETGWTLAYTRIENWHKVRKKTFVFIYVADWLLCTTTGGTEQIRLCVSRYDQPTQNRSQKVFDFTFV